MSNDSKRISELTITTTISANDRVVVLTNPDSSSNAQTIKIANLASVLASSFLPIANATHLGVIKIGAGLAIAANGVTTAPLPVASRNVTGVVRIGASGTGIDVDGDGIITANVVTLTANNANNLGGTAASGYQTTNGLSANVATLAANNASYLGGYAANQYAFANTSSFGEGFSLTDSNKIVTNKLYSTNLTQPTQHYRLTLDTNGVVHLPDESIINGATLKTVPGNYAGITAGLVGKDEDSWVWVDSDGAWIATDYSNNAFTWNFDNTGALSLPGLLTLPVTNSIPQSTPPSGTVAVSDGAGWDPESDGLEHLMIYINGAWNKVV